MTTTLADTTQLKALLKEALLEALDQSRERQPAPAPPAHTTFEEFLNWADEDTTAEWVDGKIVMTSPASLQHQNLGRLLGQLLDIWVEQKQLGQVILPPFAMRLAHSSREPDLLFVATDHLDRLRPTYLDGPADLVVEIISPESAGRDRGDKFYEYAAGGVPEYWLLDPDRRWGEFYQLAEGRYRPAFSGETGVYHSIAVPGFWLRVEWLWQQPLPPVLMVVKELGLI